MQWVDLSLAAILVLSVIFGLVRGFVFELMSLVGWVVAYLAAKWLGPWVAPHLPLASAQSSLNAVPAFIITFIAALLLWSLAARLLRMLIRATPLGIIDRLLGGLFGGLRGTLIVLLATLLIGLTPLARSAAWQNSSLAPWLETTLCRLRPLLPPLSEHLRASAARSIKETSYVRHRRCDLQNAGQPTDL